MLKESVMRSTHADVLDDDVLNAPHQVAQGFSVLGTDEETEFGALENKLKYI